MENELGTPAEPQSLRDMLTTNVDIVESGGDLNAPVETPTDDKPGRLANRARDDKGRVLPGAPNAAAPAISHNPSGTVDSPPTVPPVAAAPIQRPHSWKKEHWDSFDKIAQENPALAQYLNQREQEFQNGVSTYKTEAESAKHLNDAIAPFLPNLQKYNIEPTQWIRNLGTAHERLALGTPQEKILIGAQLIREYGIDPQGLYQLFTNPQFAQQLQTQTPQQQFDPRMIDTAVQRKVQEALSSREIQTEYQKFVNAKDDAGNPKYPHFETVKETMAGLLQAELAQDYPSAYDAAIRHPRHSDIFQAMQDQHRQQEDAKAKEVARATVNRARANAVSPKTVTPGTPTNNSSGKSLREQLSEALDDHASRV